MSEAYAQALAVVMELPEAERLALADAVYESISNPPGLSEDDPNFDATIARRVEEIRSGKVVGIPGDEFMARLRQKYQK